MNRFSSGSKFLNQFNEQNWFESLTSQMKSQRYCSGLFLSLQKGDETVIDPVATPTHHAAAVLLPFPPPPLPPPPLPVPRENTKK
jgi:hypothetical protein